MNKITVTLPPGITADDLLDAAAFGALAIARSQSGPAVGGPFVNETTKVIVSGKTTFVTYDTDGTSTTWYRSRFENAAGSVTSEWTTPVMARRT